MLFSVSEIKFELTVQLDKVKEKTKMIKDMKQLPCKRWLRKVEPFNIKKR